VTWKEYVIGSADDMTANEIVAQHLTYPGTFVVAQGHSWVVYWDNDGDEIWMRPPNEDDSAPIGQTIYADDAAYPYTYVVNVPSRCEVNHEHELTNGSCAACEQIVLDTAARNRAGRNPDGVK
jgi:hypothetical protein